MAMAIATVFILAIDELILTGLEALGMIGFT